MRLTRRLACLAVAASGIVGVGGGRSVHAGPVTLEPNPFRSLFVQAYAAAPFDPAGPPPAPVLSNKPFTTAGPLSDSNSATQSFTGDDGFRSDAAASVSLEGVLGPELITASVRMTVNSSYTGPDSSVLPPPAEAVAQTHAATRLFVTEPVRVRFDLTADLPDNAIFSPTRQELGRREARVEVRRNEREGGELLLGADLRDPGQFRRRGSIVLEPNDYWFSYVFRIDDLAHGTESYEGSAELRVTFEPVSIPLPPAAVAAVTFVPIAFGTTRRQRRQP